MKLTKAWGGIFAMLALAAPTGAQTILTNGLVAYYPFDGNANDASGNGNNLANHGATLCPDRFGNPNQAYSFNGASYLGATNAPLSEVTNWTVSAWIDPTSLPQAAAYAVCVGYDNGSSGDGYAIGITGGAGFAPGNELWACFPGLGYISDAYTFSASQWVQVVMLRSAGATQCYVNGTLTDIPNSTLYTPFTPTALEIGSGGSAHFFVGAVNDVRIYNRALAPSEIQELYNYESTPVGPGITQAPGGFTNGSFEVPVLPSGTTYEVFSQGATNLVGWTIGGTGGPIYLLSASAYGGFAPYAGQQWIGFNVGDTAPGSSVAQTFQTIVGQEYAVSFAVGASSSGSVSITASASAEDGTVLATDQCIPPVGGWSLFDLNFVATSTNTTLTFLDTSVQTIAVDVMLDDVTVTVTNAVPAGAQTILTNGLVAYYPFDGNANDASGNGNNLANHGATLCPDRFGNPNQAYSFNGASYLGATNAPLSEVTNWTVSAWIDPTSLPQAAAYAVCVGYDNGSSGDGYAIGITGGAGFAPGNELWACFPGLGYISDAYTFSASQWVQVVMLRSAGATQCYVNGTLTDIPNSTLYTPFTPTALEIGSGGSAHFFVGAVNDVRIYNRALAPSEIQELYNYESTPPPAPGESALQIVNTTASGGATVTVSVDLNAIGTESAVGFSLNFDPSVLTYSGTTLGSGASGGYLLVNQNQAATGQLGLGIALFNGTFSPGTQQLAEVTFQVAPLTNSTTTALTFGSQPTGEQVSDAHANSLPATYSPGTVAISPIGIEGDVAPRPNGDGVVRINDWVQEGRFVAGLDVASNGSEFQRADCAPRSTLGDGQITVADWVQVGRYAVGLDPVTLAGGPTGPIEGNALPEPAAKQSPAPSFTLVPLSQAGLITSVAVQLGAEGNETAMQFSLAFNPAAVRYVSGSLGSGATGAAFYQNTNSASAGRLGFVVGLAPPSTFAAGPLPLVILNFASISYSNNANFAFSDSPLARQLVDSDANVLSASYQNVTIPISGSAWPVLNINPSPGSVTLSWPAVATGFTLETTPALGSDWVSVSATPVTNGDSILFTSPILTNGGYFRLRHP